MIGTRTRRGYGNSFAPDYPTADLTSKTPRLKAFPSANLCQRTSLATFAQ